MKGTIAMRDKKTMNVVDQLKPISIICNERLMKVGDKDRRDNGKL